jgi:hypothetical protein
MFLLVPRLIRSDLGFWPSLAIGCLVTFGLYMILVWLAPRFNLPI